MEMEKYVDGTNVKVSSHIPEDLAFSILSKLPIKSLKRFGCVQKSWTPLLENLHFLSIYRNYLLLKNQSNYDDMSILINQRNEECHSTLYILSGERFENRVKLDWPPPFHVNDTSIYIVGKTSVRGTLCIVQEVAYYPKCVFWNPTIDEFKVIPSSPFVPKPIVVSNGFGYDHVGDDYKVIRWLSADEYVDPIWEIYSLRSNSWRKLDIEMPYGYLKEQLYVDGVCHWLTICNDDNSAHQNESRLVSFDLHNEVFLTTPLPTDMIKFWAFHLMLLNGSIACIIYDQNTTFSVIILGELGVKKSWTKIFIVEPLPCIEQFIGIGNKGDIFFRKYDDELVLFNLSTRKIQEVGVKVWDNFFHIITYKGNLLPFGSF
jgi:molecular chaperone HtpG